MDIEKTKTSTEIINKKWRHVKNGDQSKMTTFDLSVQNVFEKFHNMTTV